MRFFPDDHTVDPIYDPDDRSLNPGYICFECGLPAHWDGVFEGKWLHTQICPASGQY